MKRSVVAVLGSIVIAAGASLVVSPAAGGAPPDFRHLDPGGQPSLVERVPVNVVLLGYDRRDVRVGQMRSQLPRRYEPVVRSRLWYGETERLGITYTYDYDVSFATARYENRFFRQLRRLATPAPLTLFQEEYNAQVGNALDVTENYAIDAPTVERWLAYNAPRGVDTRRNTVFLINGFDRGDFRFHVYTKTDEPDPDTGYNFGVERDSRKLTAWGGTTARDEENGLGSTRRVWFHDIAAGPEAFAGSWNVDDEDLDGDGVEDYRIPPVWEYGAYRPASALSRDLGRLIRYVAIDLLFTTSPIYPVELPTPELARTVNLDANTYEGRPGVDASEELLDPDLFVAELQELLPAKVLDFDNQDFPFEGEARRCYEALLADESCYPELGFPPFANLYLQNTFELERTQDDGDAVDYELPIFNYSLPEDDALGLLGFADDNYVDGTQSYVFNFVSPGIVEAGYGLTTTSIHEVGHHVGLSHPHDGYDSGSGLDFGPSGDTYFAWLGDYSNSMMSYIDLNWDFSQFDQDNMHRFQAAAAIEVANRLAGAALDGPRPRRALDELRAADRAVGAAERLFARHAYRPALWPALRAYRLAVAAAEDAGVEVERELAAMRAGNDAARQAGPVHEGTEFIDTLEEGPRNAP